MKVEKKIEKCLICGKKIIPDKEANGTKKWDKHTFKYQCKCHKKSLRISIG